MQLIPSKSSSLMAVSGGLGLLCSILVFTTLPQAGFAAVKVDCTNTANENNTACKYTGPNPSCTRLRWGVDIVNIYNLLHKQNMYRSRVASGMEDRGNPGPQPGAKGMNHVHWDPDLATVCQLWTDQCRLTADQGRTVNTSHNDYSYVGQDCFYCNQSQSTVNITNTSSCVVNPCSFAIDQWYNQVSLFANTNVDPYTWAANTYSYVQTVWADTGDVGYGSTTFVRDGMVYGMCCKCSGEGYRSTGRVYQRAMPDRSDVCSNCTGSRTCDRSNLCVGNI